ncbi:MAG: N-acetylmuramoyl-L-alanine amidase [Proteobacteria bacterium]|nr:N-acetylmuramoyl-L-alanine amidase [Pseudomonadota bacterium]
MTKSVEVNQPKINRQSEKNLQDSYPTAVLDPTHGGDDAGSIGINSIVESNINLQVAFKLARALRMKGVKVFLTRTDDYNVTLERKFKDAEKQNPVIYISINCAYSDKRNKKGVEVYGFTPEPAEADGSEIEKTENKFYEFYEGTYVQKSQEAEAVEDRVSSSVKKELNLPYRSGLERRFFKFLSLPANIPALAVFVGYISNYNDSRLLSSEKEVDELTERLATAIESGITKQARLD